LRQANAEPLDYLLLKNPRPGTIWPIRKVWNDLIRLQDLGNRRDLCARLSRRRAGLENYDQVE
jgi:hypothetical protein